MLREEFEKELENLQRSRCTYQRIYASALVVVRKKGGGLRMC